MTGVSIPSRPQGSSNRFRTPKTNCRVLEGDLPFSDSGSLGKSFSQPAKRDLRRFFYIHPPGDAREWEVGIKAVCRNNIPLKRLPFFQRFVASATRWPNNSPVSLSAALGAISGDSCPACPMTPQKLLNRLIPLSLYGDSASPTQIIPCCMARVKR